MNQKKKKPLKAFPVLPKKGGQSLVVVPQTLPSPAEGGSALQNYKARLSKIPILSRQEEHDLAVAYYQSRDPELAKQLIQANLRFVVKIAAEYSQFSSKLMDLIQEGNVGLMKAVKEFNPYKGARLITYAVWWIRGYIQEYLMRQHSIVRLGTNKKQQKMFYLLQKERQNLESYSPKKLLPVLAKQSSVKESELEQMKELVLKKDFSLDQPINKNTGGKSFLSTQVASQNMDEEVSQRQLSGFLRAELDKMKSDFTDKEKSILKNRFLGDPPQTLQQIADQFGVTREAIRQNEDRLMQKLRDKFIPLLKKPY